MPFPLPPEPGRFREAAIKIALQNDTLRQEFGSSEIVIPNYRDTGVSHLYYDCPPNWCASVILADKSDANKMVAVLVNMNSSKVVEIRATKSLVISKTNQTQEAVLFLSKYPGTTITFDVGPGYSQVKYKSGNVTRFLSLIVNTTPLGNPTEIAAECLRDGSIIRKTTGVLHFIESSGCLA